MTSPTIIATDLINKSVSSTSESTDWDLDDLMSLPSQIIVPNDSQNETKIDDPDIIFHKTDKDDIRKHRNWFVTVDDPSTNGNPKVYHDLPNKYKLKFMVAQHERYVEGGLHFHVCLGFETQRTFKQVRDIFVSMGYPNPNLQYVKSVGDVQRSARYASKTRTRAEIEFDGVELPFFLGKMGKLPIKDWLKKRSDTSICSTDKRKRIDYVATLEAFLDEHIKPYHSIDDVMCLIKNDPILKEFYIEDSAKFKRVFDLFMAVKPEPRTTKGLFIITGAPGTGKSHYFSQYVKKFLRHDDEPQSSVCYAHSDERFWAIGHNHQFIHLPEFHSNLPLNDLKNLGDINKRVMVDCTFALPRKNRSPIHPNHELVLIDSNSDLDQWYPNMFQENPFNLEAITRRVHKYLYAPALKPDGSSNRYDPVDNPEPIFMDITDDVKQLRTKDDAVSMFGKIRDEHQFVNGTVYSKTFNPEP